ncbi:hypothetical protein [Ammoniphilus sp. YIM 78166]|uniref:hypothetical protein n=1 Tax=Ammoniphilus sp. YIM 78166 TaxID=1644106 RepID=UPI00142F989B|nr:hypothetical protein [Ammoniphilus sp. YIM 78166]
MKNEPFTKVYNLQPVENLPHKGRGEEYETYEKIYDLTPEDHVQHDPDYEDQ